MQFCKYIGANCAANIRESLPEYCSNEEMLNPSDETLFTSLNLIFPDSTKKLKTDEFLQVSSGAVSLIEKFGKVFSPVINDMKGNIKKLRRKYNENTELYQHLEDMILKEKEENEYYANEALIWLIRGLEFLSRFFECIITGIIMDSSRDDLTEFVKKAYAETLEIHHGWLGTQLFNVLSRFTPNRKMLFYTLALEKHNKSDQVLHDMDKYHSKLTICINKLLKFYRDNQLNQL